MKTSQKPCVHIIRHKKCRPWQPDCSFLLVDVDQTAVSYLVDGRCLPTLSTLSMSIYTALFFTPVWETNIISTLKKLQWFQFYNLFLDLALTDRTLSRYEQFHILEKPLQSLLSQPSAYWFLDRLYIKQENLLLEEDVILNRFFFFLKTED